MRASRTPRHAERGQVLPMWIAGVISALALAFLTANYANSVRFQIRAQNAADSAAAAVVAIQADQWNQMTSLLYAENVEEFRIRRLLDALLLAIHRSGGCTSVGYIPSIKGVFQPQTNPAWFSTAEGTCNRTYIDLRDNLVRAEERYTTNAAFLNTLALQSTFSNFQTSAQAMLTSLQTNCNKSTAGSVIAIGGDCGDGNYSNSIKYSFAPSSTSTGYGGMTGNANAIAYRTNLGAVELDAANYFIPGTDGAASKHGLDTEAKNLFAPVAVDVVACEKITPLIPSFGPFHQPTYYAVGRAAATDAMVTQEWLEPELNQFRGQGTELQYPENYTQAFPDAAQPVPEGLTTNYDWYQVYYGANDYTANTTNLTATLKNNELSALFGWWSSVPILPFGGAVSTATAC